MGAAGVLESLLRSIHRTSYRKERLIYVAQIHHNSVGAPKLQTVIA